MTKKKYSFMNTKGYDEHRELIEEHPLDILPFQKIQYKIIDNEVDIIINGSFAVKLKSIDGFTDEEIKNNEGLVSFSTLSLIANKIGDIVIKERSHEFDLFLKESHIDYIISELDDNEVSNIMSSDEYKEFLSVKSKDHQEQLLKNKWRLQYPDFVFLPEVHWEEFYKSPQT